MSFFLLFAPILTRDCVVDCAFRHGKFGLDLMLEEYSYVRHAPIFDCFKASKSSKSPARVARAAEFRKLLVKAGAM
jgi:hypothetical protein